MLFPAFRPVLFSPMLKDARFFPLFPKGEGTSPFLIEALLLAVLNTISRAYVLSFARPLTEAQPRLSRDNFFFPPFSINLCPFLSFGGEERHIPARWQVRRISPLVTWPPVGAFSSFFLLPGSCDPCFFLSPRRCSFS